MDVHSKARRRLLAGGLGLAASPFVGAQPRPADAYPTKPITMIIPSTPGGAADTMARVMAEVMSQELGQSIIMDYKAGAGGQIGAAAVAKAAPDGYTVLYTTTAPLFYAPHLSSKLPYDAKRDFTYISQVTEGGLIMLAHKDIPARNIVELVAWIRQQGKGKVTYGSYGVGTVSHLLSAYLSDSRDLGMTHVGYKGEAPFVTDLVGGHLPLGIASIWTAAPHIQAGRLRGIAVFTPKRHASVPEVPTMVESGYTDPDFGVVAGNFVVGPANLPAPVLARLEAAVRKAMASPAVHEKYLSLGTTPVVGTSAEAQKLFDLSQPRLARLVKISGATVD
jgi:tripartite-type tricarboxylate transporter receptor subunit TctC